VLGLRWGEAAGVRVGAIDCLRGIVHVVEQVTRGQGGVAITSEPKSNAGTPDLAMPQWLTDLAAAHLSRNGLTGAEPTALLFPNARGGPMDYSHWRSRVWLPAVRAADVEGVRFHDLRRAAATVLVAAGVDPKTRQTRMGHSDIRLTLAVYAQSSDDRDRAAAEVVGAAFTPPSASYPCHSPA
jgi:integrase